MWAKKKDDQKSHRIARVNHLLRGELVSILSREVKDPRVGNVTLTDIETSPDLRDATVYVCRFLGDDLTLKQQLEIESGLSAASQFIYETLKRRLCLKSIPRLRFRYDSRLAQASQVWNLQVRSGANSNEEINS